MDLKGGNFPELIRRRFAGSQVPEDFSPRRMVGDLPPGFLPKQPWRPASVLLPLVTHPEGPTVLLTRRTDQLQDHGGQVSFPGGGREPQDPDPVATALRETREEIGLGHEYVEVVGYLRGYLTISGYAVTPVVGLVRPGFTLVPDPLEVAEVFEVPLAFLADTGNRQVQTREVGGEQVGFYLFEYRQHTIWGATAAMLVNFLDTLKAEDA
ncbi:MAG TPA: CoA pyrophosphatase [Gammaproteobacteria bacterium]|jgi:8-oxo-dGTP pyrophosphatase MutT (NUDIX family)|nr:CoA pyrophosphatase [Gammaproteobacteria bacterium]